MGQPLEQRLTAVWYGDRPPAWWLRAIAAVYHGVLAVHRGGFRVGLFSARRIAVPVIVVGNITVGGTGKTPLSLWLVKTLAEAGFKPGIISRGYRSSAGRGPLRVEPDSSVSQVGDEPLLMARRSGVPVLVGSDRVAAAQAAVAEGCDVIVSDDGLQHRRLARDLEIVVIDARRGLGNGRLLPAGPLREPAVRLKTVDYVVGNGGGGQEIVMQLEPGPLLKVLDDQPGPALDRIDGRVCALAGIGHPERFFETLAGLSELPMQCHPFPDHHDFCAGDFSALGEATVIMTEKDAVKCRSFARENWYYLPVEAGLPDTLGAEIVQRIKGLRQSSP